MNKIEIIKEIENKLNVILEENGTFDYGTFEVDIISNKDIELMFDGDEFVGVYLTKKDICIYNAEKSIKDKIRYDYSGRQFFSIDDLVRQLDMFLNGKKFILKDYEKPSIYNKYTQKNLRTIRNILETYVYEYAEELYDDLGFYQVKIELEVISKINDFDFIMYNTKNNFWMSEAFNTEK